MNKEYKIKLDLNKKLYNKKMAFNQFDENVNDFYIEVTKNNKVVKDLDKSIITLVAIKPNSEVDAQFIEVKEGQIYANLKPSMCDLVGNYQAKAMIVLEGEIVTTDTINYSVNEDKIISRLNEDVVSDERFTLFTDALARLSDIEASEEQRITNEAERILAEENRKIEEAKRVEAELIRQHEEADRTKYDATRESNENIRKQNESIRLANETNRIDEEAKRVEEESKRKLAEEERNANYNFMTEDEERRRSEANAHKEAEVSRVQAETDRVNEEAKRRTTEQARVSAENTRVSNENTRETNELTRQSNETKRVEAETQRKNRYNSFIVDAEANANNFENYTNTAKAKEEERKANELDRKSQEDRRVSNEVERISNENTRKANEVIREENETSRQNTFANKVSEVDEKIVELNTTKDNFVSSINTKVDNKISELDNAKTDMSNTVSNKVNEVENRFNALTSKQQQDAEVIDARDGETSLKARLDRDIEKAKQVYVNVEGSNISTDSSSGYVKDVEILGNTIQDASNLADIRSVGDKVEGQELYEIPVLSCGKNLFNIDNISSNIISKSNDTYEIRTNTPVDLYNKGIFKAVKNVQYTVSYKAKLGTATNFRADFVYTDGSFQQFSYCNSTTEFIQITKTSDKNKQLDYVRFNWTNTGTVYIKDIQIEEGTVATPYEPYIEDKLTILSPVQLEKGDVLKEVNGVWGVVKSNIDKLIKGNEDIVLSGTQNLTNVMRFHIQTSDSVKFDSDVFCDKFKSEISYNGDFEHVYINSAQRILFYIEKSKLTTQDVSGFKAWLQSNNVLVKYPINESTFIPLPHDQQVKLRTFANKTNISFLTEIEGTIKAQVPKSLGATVNTHTEQISNLNKELDRVKKLEESTVSTVTTESDFTTVEATSNGYFEDVKLEGKTLVNLADPMTSSKWISGGSGNPTLEKNNNSLKVTMQEMGSCILTNNELCEKLQIGKTYTIVFSSKVTNISDELYFGLRKTSTSTYVKVATINNDGVYCVSFTITETFDRFLFGTVSPVSTLGSFEISNVMLLEGDHTQNPPSYFEGLKSVGDTTDEIVVESVKGDGNLIDLNNAHSKYCTISSDSIVGTNEYNDIQFYVYLEKGMQYFFNSDGSHDVNGNIMYGIQKNYNASATLQIIKDLKTKPFTFIGDTGFYTLHIPNFRGIVKDIQLVKGTTPKPYVPYQSDKKRLLYYNNETQTWEKPILRQWDSIEKHSDGKYYYHQRSVEVVLNGSENWSTQTGGTLSNSMLFQVSLNNAYIETNGYASSRMICDKFKINTHANLYVNDEEGLANVQNISGLRIRVLKSKLTSQDVTGFKQWLQANNVTVVYQLAQEKVYECTNIDLITYANETNYVVNSGVITPRTTLKVHNNISNVVSLLQKKVSLLESNVTSYMITQNRLMLASRYNADTVSFKVDVATLRNSFEYDNDLYELILNNILVGKDNYNREYIENLIIFYWMDFIISDEMYLTLFEIIEEQHNPKVIEEAPIE